MGRLRLLGLVTCKVSSNCLTSAAPGNCRHFDTMPSARSMQGEPAALRDCNSVCKKPIGGKVPRRQVSQYNLHLTIVSIDAVQNLVWLVVWTPLKNISQLGWLFPIYGKIETVPNHQPVVDVCHRILSLSHVVPCSSSSVWPGSHHEGPPTARWRLPGRGRCGSPPRQFGWRRPVALR